MESTIAHECKWWSGFLMNDLPRNPDQLASCCQQPPAAPQS